MESKLMSTFKERFNLDIPKGILYYPCCGGDTYEPLLLFRDSIDEFHFTDINRITLPETEYRRNNKVREFTNCRRIENIKNEYLPLELVNKIEILDQRSCNTDIGELVNKYLKVDLGSVRVKNSIDKEIWYMRDNKKIEIVSHKMDGFLALSTIDNISVFYYRGDSPGDGGSGQWWFGKDIFNVLLDKLVNGALILTDGSNPNPYEQSVPWKPLFDKCSSGSDFQYKDRSFKYIGICGKRHGDVKAWKVIK